MRRVNGSNEHEHYGRQSSVQHALFYVSGRQVPFAKEATDHEGRGVERGNSSRSKFHPPYDLSSTKHALVLFRKQHLRDNSEMRAEERIQCAFPNAFLSLGAEPEIGLNVQRNWPPWPNQFEF